jgi:GNAT superfamily N-acetyltransferase
MSDITVRRATAEDAAAIKHVGEAAWPATYAFAGEEYVAHGLASWWSDEAVLRGLRTTDTFVAERDGVVIGMGNIDLRGERPVIWKLYVLPSHHGAGAGHALMEALLDQAPRTPTALPSSTPTATRRRQRSTVGTGSPSFAATRPNRPAGRTRSG